MALTSFLPAAAPIPQYQDLLDRHHHHHSRKSLSKKKKKKNSGSSPATLPPPPPSPIKAPVQSSWEQFKNLLSCRSTAASVPSMVYDPSNKPAPAQRSGTKTGNHGSSCGSSICALRDVAHGNTRVVHRSDSADRSSLADSEHFAVSETVPLARRGANASQHQPQSRGSGVVGGMHLPRLSGCYECHAIDAEPASRRYPRPRTLSACTECGEVFTKPESLELHQIMRHAVSELGPEDSGRNIVEIIFKSSWLKKGELQLPHYRIDRILKVHKSSGTINRFEDYRSAIKARYVSAAVLKKNIPRCAADGNELLRFHSTSLACPLGANGSSSLCTSVSCGVCGIIRHGFPRGTNVKTTASSGRAHESSPYQSNYNAAQARAMLVCRVIAGRVRRAGDELADEFDSVAGEEGLYGNLEELFVANSRAILPCFVVIYRVVE